MLLHNIILKVSLFVFLIYISTP